MSVSPLDSIQQQVPAGTREPRPPNSSRTFISTPSHARLIAEMMQSHMVKDICLIGAKVAITHDLYTHTAQIEKRHVWSSSQYFLIFQGCGKSVIAKEFAEMLGYSVEPVMLYQVKKSL